MNTVHGGCRRTDFEVRSESAFVVKKATNREMLGRSRNQNCSPEQTSDWEISVGRNSKSVGTMYLLSS